MILDYIDGRINLAIGLIGMLIFIMYFLQIDIQEYRAREECDDSDDPRKLYRWY